MDFNQFLLILKARSKIIKISFVSIVLLALVISLVLPKTYTATTSLVLDYKGADPVTGASIPAQLMPGYMATQIDIITSHNSAVKVVDILKLTDSTVAREQYFEATNGHGDFKDWLADKLLKKLVVIPSRDSNVIELSYSGTDPEFVMTIANAFATAYQQASIQLKVEPAQKVAEFLDEQTKKLRANLEQAEAKLNNYKQEKGLTGESNSLDIEKARLNDISSQLAVAEAQASEANSRQKGTLGSGNASPDVAASPVVQNLKIQVSMAESKFSELSQRLGPSHPQYQAAELELNKLKSLLSQAIMNASSTIAGTATIHKQQALELRAALETQKDHVLELNLARSELSVLEREVGSAQNALDTANIRFTQAKLESNINQSGVAVLNPAITPSHPSGPNLLRNLMVSIILGLILGVGFALLAEMLDRRVRSKDDIHQLLEVPVFMVVQSKSESKSNSRFKSISRKMLMLPKQTKPV